MEGHMSEPSETSAGSGSLNRGIIVQPHLQHVWPQCVEVRKEVNKWNKYDEMLCQNYAIYNNKMIISHGEED